MAAPCETKRSMKARRFRNTACRQSPILQLLANVVANKQSDKTVEATVEGLSSTGVLFESAGTQASSH